MTTTITLVGHDALNVGLLANRQPEVLLGDSWHVANGMPMVGRILRTDPQSVRLIGNARCLLEDILKVDIPSDADLAAFIDARTPDSFSTAEKANAITIIRSKL